MSYDTTEKLKHSSIQSYEQMQTSSSGQCGIPLCGDASFVQPQIPSAENEAHQLSASITTGSPSEVKAAMGKRIGADFSSVRFHTGTDAAAKAHAMGARAFTSGRDIYFGSGGFDASVAAHELVHTAQQGAVASTGVSEKTPFGGVQMWPSWLWPFRKKRSTPKPSKALNFFSRIYNLKCGRSNVSSSVAKLKTSDKKHAVLKMGSNPLVENTLSDYYNEGGAIFDKTHRGTWSFDTPAARPLLPKERPQAEHLVRQGILSTPTSTSAADENIDDITIFTMANGRSRVDPGTKAAREEGAIITNPSDPKEEKDYRRTLGYVAVMDLIVGNTDRITGAVNPENWLEERDIRQMHLIDNNFHASHALQHGKSGRSDWLLDIMNRLEEKDSRGKSTGNYSAQGFADHLASNRTDLDQPFFGAGTEEGVMQAMSDLRTIRTNLEKKFNASGEITPHQKELLIRLQIVDDIISDHELATLYRELSYTGFDTSTDDCLATTNERQLIMKRLQKKRLEKGRPALEISPPPEAPNPANFAPQIPEQTSSASQAPEPTNLGANARYLLYVDRNEHQKLQDFKSALSAEAQSELLAFESHGYSQYLCKLLDTVSTTEVTQYLTLCYHMRGKSQYPNTRNLLWVKPTLFRRFLYLSKENQEALLSLKNIDSFSKYIGRLGFDAEKIEATLPLATMQYLRSLNPVFQENVLRFCQTSSHLDAFLSVRLSPEEQINFLKLSQKDQAQLFSIKDSSMLRKMLTLSGVISQDSDSSQKLRSSFSHSSRN